jgi:MoxR-like ATPase
MNTAEHTYGAPDHSALKQKLDLLDAELHKAIVGQQHLLTKLKIGLLTNGHILLEGMPGLAKTLAIKSLAQAIGGTFSRVQFTPDLLPADVVGTMIYNQQKAEFVVKHGPIFANFVLADEINRAPAKVQSALLEAMQERQVTLGDKSYPLQYPFLVLATQNPVEQEGTYTLPEAQADRFMMKVLVDYPSKQDELHIMRQNISADAPQINKVLSTADIAAMVQAVRNVKLDERIENYILDIVHSTRSSNGTQAKNIKSLLSYGASPRASIALANAAKANAFLGGRAYVLPEDVRACCVDVLRHRIGLSYEAEATGVSADQIIGKILDTILVP